MKNIKIFIFVLLIALSSSCNKESGDFSVTGDAVVIAKTSGNSTVYAMAYYAYASSPLKTVSVQSMLDPSNQVELASNGGYKTIFIREPDNADFSTIKPSSDTFTFSAIFENGNTYQTTDVVSSSVLAPPTIENCTYNTEKAYAEFSWTALANADSYVISVYNDEGSVVFRSSEVSSTVTSGYLSASATGWSSGFPVSGETYKVRIFAFKYEDSTNPSSYHVQSTSYSETSLLWD